jgi:hypothetical protein
MTWIKIDIVEVLDDDNVVLSIVDRLVRSSDHPYLQRPIDVPELLRTVSKSCTKEAGVWEGVWQQFLIDFPRYQLYLNRIRCTDAAATLEQLRAQMDEETARQIVTLATQGVLADVYFHLVALLVKDCQTHVVDGAGAYHIHIEAPPGGRVALRVSKRLGLTRMQDDEPTSVGRIRVMLQLQLQPVMRGTETMEILPAT